jgi:hypothetical protein
VNVIQKNATVSTVESENPNGEFEVVLSTETLDRDNENLWAQEWRQPLPARIHIDGDHGRSLDKTVGSAVPRLEGNKMIGKGTFAGTPYAQMVRQLVNEGHVNTVSVTYAEHKNQKDNSIQRELLNAAFVAIPANPEAVVLSSKSIDKAEGGLSASGDNPTVPKHDEMVQAIHDAACHLGAQCLNDIEADPGTADGANKSVDEETSSTKDAGSPKESPDDSPAEAATKAAADAPAEVPAEAADESADDTAHQKAKEAEKARALAFLIGMNTKD